LIKNDQNDNIFGKVILRNKNLSKRASIIKTHYNSIWYSEDNEERLNSDDNFEWTTL
jgi:hypothetical protein